MRTAALRGLAGAAVVFVLSGCAQEDPFAELGPRALPEGTETLAAADGWTVTEGGVRAEAGGEFTLAVPEQDVPDGPGEAVLTYHLDRIEPDGTIVETVDVVAVAVTAEQVPQETMTLPDEPDAHYDLFAEVARADGTFDRYQDWLYVPAD